MNRLSSVQEATVAQEGQPAPTPAPQRRAEKSPQLGSRRGQTAPLPASQHPDFPLSIEEGTGQWKKKIRGVKRRFGSVKDDPTGEKAWEQYKQERAFWEAGQNPRLMARAAGNIENATPVVEITDRWLQYRDNLVTIEDPELRIDRRTYDDSSYAVRRFLQIVDEISDRGADPLKWSETIWERIRTKLGQNVTRRKNGETEMKAASPATKGSRINAIRMAFQWWARQPEAGGRLPAWGESFACVGESAKEEFRYDYQQEHGERVFEIPEARMILECVQIAAERAGLNSNNSSGYRGVSQRPDGKFEAYIVRRVSRVRTKFYLGVFDTAEEASIRYEEEAQKVGSEYQRRLIIGSKLFCACTLLAANTGAYSRDISALLLQNLDLPGRYLERKRTKTSVLWQAMLWPETVVAIEDYLKVRPEPAKPEFTNVVFLTSNGVPVNLDSESRTEDGKYSHTNRKDHLKARMRRLLLDLGIKSQGVGFGAWRHTFRSLASSALGVRKEDLEKFDAINRTMAHRIPGSANRYVHLRREQLQPIADIVREQIWPEKVQKEKEAAALKAEQRRQADIAGRFTGSTTGSHLRLVS